jgi:cobalt-zinc-cadmium efflux system membrane fusion protein
MKPELKWLLAALATAAACSRDRAALGSKPGSGADSVGGAVTDAMAGMPGMKTGEISLTGAQVEHGRIRWEPAAVGPDPGTTALPGQLVPNEDRTARLGAPAGGRIVSIPVRPGDRVPRGRVLVTLQSPEAGIAQADLAKAEAEAASRRAQALYARGVRERAERLTTLKAIPRQDYERAIADDELARAALAQAEAELRRARTTSEQLGASASASGLLELRSPQQGVVLARTALPGAVVEAGTPLVVVTDPSSLWLVVSAPEPTSGRFRIGNILRFSVPAFPADTFAAPVDAVGAGLDPATRTLSIRATVNSSGGRLKPEMLATVLVRGKDRGSAVLLPADAVQLVNGHPTVFIATPDGKGGARFEARTVKAGPAAGSRIAVMEGVSVGELIVVQGAFTLKAELQKSAGPRMVM